MLDLLSLQEVFVGFLVGFTGFVRYKITSLHILTFFLWSAISDNTFGVSESSKLILYLLEEIRCFGLVCFCYS